MPSRKKNRRKGKGGAEGEEPPALGEAGNGQAEDGGGRIMQECARRGYPMADVRSCLDFMWNSGMPLDNLDLVLQQLQARSPTASAVPVVRPLPLHSISVVRSFG